MHPPEAPSPPPAADRAKKPAAGFTMVEVVAVVVILGLLGALIVSRYLEFVDKVSDTVGQSVAGEGVSRFKSAYSQYLLDAHTKPATISDLSGTSYLGLDSTGRVNIGDYDLVYTQSGDTLTVNAYAKGGSTTVGNATAPWP
jgi:prepilin-type N-terminal cleavage/methylation domain-containing protein